MFKMGKFREVEIRFVALGRRVREKKNRVKILQNGYSIGFILK